MTELSGLIYYWKDALATHRYLLNPSVIYLIEATIEALQELQSIKGGRKCP